MSKSTVSARLTFAGISDANKRTNQWVKQLEKALTILNKLEQKNAFARGTESASRYRQELGKLKEELSAVAKEENNRTRDRRRSSGSGTGSGSSPASTNPREVRELSTILNDLDKQIIGTQTAIRLLNREAKEGVGRTDDEYQELLSTLAKLKQESKAVTDEVREQQRAFAAAETAEGSYRRINEQLGQLRKRYKELSREDRDGDIGKELLQNIQLLDRELKELDASMGLFQRNVGNYRSAFNALSSALAFAGVELSLQGVKTGLESIIRLNSDASTAFAGVQKTVSDLNQEELAELEDILKNRINAGETSSSLVDLLGIAEVGGRLGVAKDDIAGFVSAIDTAVVALSDDLGGSAEEIATDLQKISGIFVSSREDVDGTADGILRVGSAINELAANGPASASFLVDFSKRLAGVAPAARVSIEEVLAFGAVLEEAGQSQEVAGTAFSQILNVIGSDVEKFANVAGLTVEEFRDTLQTSGTEALLAVLEGSGRVEGGLEELSATLEKFGISGQRTAGVLAALVNNTDAVREKIALSNQAFAENVSLSAEAERVNQALSNRLANLQNAFQNAFTDLEVQEALSSIIDRIIDLLRVLQESGFTITGFTKTIANNIPSLIAMGVAVAGLSAKYVVLQARTATVTIAQRLLNNVVRANPFGAIVALISALAIGYFQLEKNIDVVQQRFQQFRERLDEVIEGTGIFSRAINVALFPIHQMISVIGFLLDAIESFPATLQGVQASFRTFFSTITSSLSRFAGGAVTLLGNFTKGLLFTGTGREILKQNVADLREAAGDFANAGEDAGKAYANARDEYLKENPPREAVEESVRSAREGFLGEDATEDGGDGGNVSDNAASRSSGEAQRRLEERLRAVEQLEQVLGSRLREAYQNLSTEEVNGIREQTEAALSEAEQKARKQQLQAELAYQEQLALLEGQLIAGQISESEFSNESQNLELARQSAILEAEQGFLQTKLDLFRQYASDTELLEGELLEKQLSEDRLLNAQRLSELETQLAEEKKLRDDARKEELKAQREARKIELEQERQQQSARQSILRSGVSFAQSLNDALTQSSIDSATARIENEEERAAEIERIRAESAERQKAIALFEIGVNLIREISALSVAAAPDLTQVTRTILTLAAIARAGAAAAAVVARQLEEGGELGNMESNQSGSHIPGQGPILGPSHADGGIMAIDPTGQLIELEGQEYALKNGSETYVINKRSALQFRPLLDQLASVPPSVYSPGKRLLASMINSYQGNGVRFENGGPLGAPALPITATNAMLSQQQQSGSNASEINTELVELISQLSFAINGRIDNLQVTANARQLLNLGTEQKKLRRDGL